MLPSKPYENPEQSGLWLPLFRRGPSRAGDPAPEITRWTEHLNAGLGTENLRWRGGDTREGGQVFGTDVGRPPGWLRTLSSCPPAPADFCCSHLLAMVKQVERLSLGIFHPAFAPIEHIRQQLQDLLPTDIHVLASQRLGISLTRWPDGHNIIVTDFATRREVIQVRAGVGPGPWRQGTAPHLLPGTFRCFPGADTPWGWGDLSLGFVYKQDSGGAERSHRVSAE